MATYVISDIHGCKKEFDQMMKMIDFNPYDDLWIIGDVCDRGPKSIELLLTIMQHENMHLIMGNHDEWLLRFSQNLIDAKKGMPSGVINPEMSVWLHRNGGLVTADEFMNLDLPTCYDIKLFLEKVPYFHELVINQQKYVLVHAGLGAHENDQNLRISAVSKHDLIWTNLKENENPWQDKILVVGHRPTFYYGNHYDGKMILGTKVLHIDCGCVYGRTLGCLRLDDMKEFYIPSSHRYLQLNKY